MTIFKQLLPIFFVAIFCFNGYSQIVKLSNATISDINFELTADKRVLITYNIVGGKTSELFDVSVTILTESNTKLDAKSLSGDIKNVPAGLNKKITWDISKDIAYLDENIHIELEAKHINPRIIPYTSKGKALLWSSVFPGIGSTRLGQNKIHVLKGIIAYTCIALSVKYNNDAVKAYDNYKVEFNPAERNSYLSKAQSKQNLSSAMVYTAVSVWLVDYVNIMLMSNKTEKKKGKLSFVPTIDYHTKKPTIALAWSF